VSVIATEIQIPLQHSLDACVSSPVSDAATDTSSWVIADIELWVLFSTLWSELSVTECSPPCIPDAACDAGGAENTSAMAKERHVSALIHTDMVFFSFMAKTWPTRIPLSIHPALEGFQLFCKGGVEPLALLALRSR
jgi:hypothetical protein